MKDNPQLQQQDIAIWLALQMKFENFKVNKARAVMSSASSAVTYTSVYTDSEPDRAFWGADDEEISEGGIPRVIVLGYNRLPMQPVALLERITKKRTKNKAKTTKPDSEWKRL
ncbi:hypothetical protein Tco_0847063 [Tanacetum coccineum]